MDHIYLTIIILSVLLIGLNMYEKYHKSRESFQNSTNNPNPLTVVPNLAVSRPNLGPVVPGVPADVSNKFLVDPDAVLVDSPMFRNEGYYINKKGDLEVRDDGSHRGELDFYNQLPAPYQHYGNRNQIYDFSMYGDQPFVQCAKCKQNINCVQYPNTASDKYTNVCTECSKPAQMGLVREIGYYPPEIQARAIGFSRMCSPSD
jgi:hypothetical protein